MNQAKINDGGPAFPSTVQYDGRNICDIPGMSLRDWFAGQALAGLLASQDRATRIQDNVTQAFAVADAMLAVRSEGGAA